MKTRTFSLLLPGLALLGTLVLPLSSAHARTAPQTNGQTLTVTNVGDRPSSDKQFAGDKKKPKPTPGPQDGDDN